jgi:2'-5' RNA ligase
MSTEQKIRLFIALDLPEVNDQGEPIGYADVQLLLKNAFPNFRPTSKVHVTLVFIGSVAQSSVSGVKDAVATAVHEFIDTQNEGLANGISGLMVEPGGQILGKNAVAFKVADNQMVLRLILYLQTALKEAGIDFDIPSHEQLAHVTIGRIPMDTVDEIQLQRILQQLQAPLGARANAQEAFTASTITLYQSLPGSNYIPLQTYAV